MRGFAHPFTPVPVSDHSLLQACGLFVALWCCTAPLSQAVGLTTTATTLSVGPGASVTQGTLVTLRASVDAGGAPVLLGSVAFYDGTRVLGRVQVVNSGSAYTHGTANWKLFLGPGAHAIQAVYGGTNSYAASASAVAPLTVGVTASANPTATTIAATGNAGNYTLTGTVTAESAAPPTGTVSFVDQSHGNFVLGTVPLDVSTQTNGWQSLTSYGTASPSYGVILGDLNGDGISDLVTSNYGGTTISVLLGNGDGTFRTHVDYPVGALSFGLTMGDLNGDGIPDVVVAFGNSNGVKVFLGNGGGSLQAAQNYATEGVSEYVVLADFNNDGILDLATCSAGGGGSVSILLGNGDGTFALQHAFGVSVFPDGLAVGDFNGDGNADLVVSNNPDNTVSLFLGNGDGTFRAPVDYVTGTAPTNVVVADLNGDGKQDLVVCDSVGVLISALLGNGDGTFQGKVDYAGFNNPWGVAAVDINGDGILDVVVTSPSARAVEVFQGKGDGTLLPPVTTLTGATNYLLALGDLNGDGVVDLAVPNISASGVGVALGSITASATLAGVSVPGGGMHNVVASYSGDANASTSTSAPIPLTGTLFTTTLALNAAPTSGAPGQAIVLTADLSPASGSGYTAAGTVTFCDGGVAIGSPVNLVSGLATLSKSNFTNGIHSITASYSGDSNFLASSAAATTVITVTPTQTITFVAFSPVSYGVPPLLLNATASSGLPVTFSLVAGPATVSGTTLTVTGAGTVVVEADQAGDSTYPPAPPVQRTLDVSKAVSTVALVTSDENVAPGTNVTFTATVAAGSLSPPPGAVVFWDSATQLASVPINSAGGAAFTTATLALGTHSIRATYAGNSNFLAAGAVLTEAVVGPDYSITANPAEITLRLGERATSVITITPVGGFKGSITLTCARPPQIAACSLTPTTVVLPGDDLPHTAQFTLTTSIVTGSPGTQVASTWYGGSENGSIRYQSALAWLSPFGILACISSGRRRKVLTRFRRLRSVKMWALSGVLLGLTACGGGRHDAPFGHWTIVMTATTVGGSTHHVANITITIKP